MTDKRQSGVLLHITSLHSSHGIGNLGQGAYNFIRFLVASKQKLWQILPLGPIGACNSPYTSFSAFAGNPLLIDIEQLTKAGLLTETDVGISISEKAVIDSCVDFASVIPTKTSLLQKAYARHLEHPISQIQLGIEKFIHKHQYWLEDYCLYMALKEHFHGEVWTKWPDGIKQRQPQIIKQWKTKLRQTMDYHCFIQYLFFDQWSKLKSFANNNGIKIIGDLPIFVAHDSADVWAHRSLFKLDHAGKPKFVAGVPPDYFSKTGQMWGNPLYHWGRNKAEEFHWWMLRLKTLLGLVDIIRIDHFRGFEAYWSIPFGEKTAVKGSWQKGPGASFFQAIEAKMGRLPIIAEDLGFITEEVEELRDSFNLPGMRVLQFAFDGLHANIHTPHNHVPNSVAYTGTHDNNTSLGWYNQAAADVKHYALKYLGTAGQRIAWDFIRAVLASPANRAIIPLQDILSLGSEARMNTPGTTENNWQWMAPAHISDQIVLDLATLTELYER